jgi:hypothetical protein
MPLNILFPAIRRSAGSKVPLFLGCDVVVHGALGSSGESTVQQGVEFS